MLHILGAGSYHPKTELHNTFLEDLGIESSAQWIVDKIGIEVRRTVLPLEYIKSTKNIDYTQALAVATDTPASMATAAARDALKFAGIDPGDVGLVIANCCAPTNRIPNESESVAKLLKIDAPTYDVFTACPAFALHLDYLTSIEPSELPDYILCFSSAALTTKVDYRERSDSAIWGDGAAAWIVSPRKTGKFKLLGSSFMADPSRAAAVVINDFGHFHQDGRAVRDFSVRQTVRMLKDIEKQFEINWEQDIFIGHQANRTMLDQIVRNRGIPECNHWFNVTSYGNQAGAGAPSVLAENWNRFTKGSKLVTAVLGAGLSWGYAVFEVAE